MTSFNPEEPADRRQLYDAMMGKSEPAKDWINRSLQVANVTISPASKYNEETDTVERWYRCVLTLEDGTRVSFGSMGVLKSLALYADCFGPPPWKPAATMILKAETTSAGGTWYTLTPPDEEPSKKKPK